jgi:PadR family transcriptional regulator, regulatory protein PadR
VDNEKIPSYNLGMRRRQGTLLPIEVDILEAGLDLQRHGEPEFHGFAIAKSLRDRDGARRLIAHGTLYKALARLEQAGMLESRWEDPETAAAEQRPRRRLYRVSGAAEGALAQARSARRTGPRPAPGLEPS